MGPSSFDFVYNFFQASSGGIAPSGSFRYSGIALSALANLKSLQSSASGCKKKGSILAKAHPQKK
jgi:hypothetical protein